MTTADFLSYLRRLDVKVWVENGEVFFNAPKGVLTPALRAELTERKAKILPFLHAVASATRSAEFPLQRISRDGRLPLSFSQERLWFLDQLEPGNSAYNVPMAVGLAGPLNMAALERSLNEIVRRHEALRTRFAVVNGQPVQVIAPAAPLRLALIDLQGIAGAEREAESRRLATEEAQRPFNLARGPLLRAKLLRLGEEDHVLLLPMHHIVSDGWSRGVLFRELSVLYENFSSGKPSPLPDLSIQYADFAVWQRRWLQGEVLEGQLGYWKKHLADAPTVLDLPTDRPRSPVQTFHGARQSLVLSQALTSRLKALSHRESVTLFVTLLAAFQALLHRYTSQDDIVVGSPIAGRTRTEIEGLIGLFVNTLALRTDLSGDPSFRELLGRVREVALDAYAHRDLPFEKLVEELQPERDLSRSPLFQVMFVLQNAPMTPLRLSGLTVTPLRVESKTAKFDLTVSMLEEAGLLRGSIEYNTDLFNGPTIARMSGHFQILLEGIVANPEQRLSSLPILTDAEKQQLLVEWNDTRTDYPAEACVHELFEAQAARTPEAVAVEYEGRRLTYGELDARANQLAHHLARHGVGPEVMVGICVERSLEMVVGVLGILKAGGAYVPLDPDYPAARLAFMLEDTAAPVLLTQARLQERLPAYGGRTVCLDADWPQIARERQDEPNVRVSARNLAYVIYTSGSTGRPKGACIEHRSVVRLVQSTNYVELGPREVILQLAPISFDASTLELWGSLLNGAKLVVCRAGLLSLQELGRVIQERGVTTLWLTAALFHQMVDEQIESLRGVRQLLAGGETLSVPHVRRMLEVIGADRLINGYGPTENTTFTCCHVMNADARIEHSVPIGRPISNTRVYVLDGHMRPVPVGVYGELYIGGAGLAREYLHQPQLTAEKFVADPFSNEPGARLYRSGDRVRFRADGCIEFLGRIDHQVKIRGFRIELGEIESALQRHPAVREVVVLAREDAPGDKRLVAYVVPENAAADWAEQLRAHLRAHLPEYMVPPHFVALEALPLTPNGKVDRKALPAPGAGACSARGYEAPAGEIETALAHIWADVLKVERVGRHDHFFELGGHSLLAVSVIERMRRAGLHADVRTLFATPTLAALAAAVGGVSGLVEVPPNRIPLGCDAITPEMLPLVQLTSDDIERIVGAVPGGAANIQDVYPLAPLQEGILFHHLMATEGDTYLVSALFGFDSRDRLEGYLRALQAAIDRHDILRTAVLWEGLPEPVQVVWRCAPLVVEEVSLETVAGDVAQQLRARFDARHYRLDVRQAPLLRVFIAHDAANARWVMLQLSHHLAIDHITQGVVRQEIQAHLLGQAGQLPTPLPFRNFVAQARLGVSREEHKAFFQKMLGDVDEPTAPFGLSDVRGDGSGLAQARRRVDASLARRLRERARSLGVSAASVCHLAWAQVLARVSGRDDVVFGTVLLGRMQGGEGAERAPGLFINTLPVRIRISDETVQDSVRHTHTLLAQLLRHEHAPLALAQRCSGVAAPAPLFSALLNYRHSAPAVGAPAGAHQAREGIDHLGGEERTNYPFVLSVDDLGEGFALTAQVQTPADPARICAFMHTALEQLVGALESAPTTSVRSLDVLPETERRQAISGWNQAVSYPKGGCLHERFERQVELTPDAVALSCEGEKLTYAELNRRANRLAYRLRERGVKPEQLVGLRAERGVEMVIGIVGILKAGAAYLPLDPVYPKERVAFMLEDARVAIVLTQRALTGDLEGLAVTQLLLDEPLSGPDTNPAPVTTADSLAYVIYTSGSTGKPKGALITHYNVTRLFEATDDWYHFDHRDVWTLFHSFAFDFSVWELWGALLYGGRLVVVPYLVSRSPGGFRELLISERVTVLNQTPSAFRQLIQADLSQPKADLALRCVIFGGEALELQSLRPWFERYGDERPLLVNMYGITETTVHVTYRPIRQADLESGQGSVIGNPIPDLQIYILDPGGQPAPIGVPGEMYVGGAGVARGYLNRDELTAQRFIAAPFAPANGARLYRTGDLARRLESGDIEYLGRIDRQVKVRGFRIELGEIEAGIAQHPAVRNAVVIAREDVPGDKRLVAYLVAENPPADLRDQLRAHLRATLPEYMIPAAFVALEALPLTPNGKVDRKALPAPEAGAYAARGYEAPVGEIETALAHIWCDVLQRRNISINDNFFDLGGHSLLAMQVISRVRDAFEVDLPLRNLWERPTVAAMAEAVDALWWLAKPKAPARASGDREEIEL